ncbi:MAG: acyl-CoA dehydratase activase-related protein, partial [Bacillota bacterium]
EACLPVKVFYGHVLDLCRKGVDYIFLPRIVSVERRAFSCPKLLGLPDMIKHNLRPFPYLIDETVNLSRTPRQLYGALWRVAAPITRNPLRIAQAWRRAAKAQAEFQDRLRCGYIPGVQAAGTAAAVGAITVAAGAAGGAIFTGTGRADAGAAPGLTVAVLGHPYNVYDRHISLDIVSKLRQWGVRVVTADMVPHHLVDEEMEQMPKDLFWSTGRRVLGSAYYLLRSRAVDGLVHLVSFGCGPDSLVGELVQRRAARLRTTPFLLLTLDEHSGEAGLVTRLEAFMDMVGVGRR